jgi:pyruvate/2-oxoglutarate dehydrogenase complex dihydrolipoamide acyltransferase (E2) component
MSAATARSADPPHLHPSPVRSGLLRRRREGAGYTLRRFPVVRRAYADGLGVAQRQHTIHALVEADVTEARRVLSALEDDGGAPISFTAWVSACVARAVEEHPMVQAHRWGRGTLVLFDDVDVSVQIDDVLDDGSHVVRSRVLRAANRRRVPDLSAEVHRASTGGSTDQRRQRATTGFARLPRLLRVAGIHAVTARPFLSKRLAGTVVVTSVGMFGSGLGWGIPVSPAPLSVTVGGIGPRPELVDGRLENRDHVSLTVSVDHDLVDGALAARYSERLTQLLEEAHGLDRSTQRGPVG